MCVSHFGWRLLLGILSFSQWAHGEIHVLLDSTKEAQLDWNRFPSSGTPGWVEESYTDFDKSINWRCYVACDVGYPNVNNWLRTPLVRSRGVARLYIEIKFSVRNCRLFPGEALQCKETFRLYASSSSSSSGGDSWDQADYTMLDRIAADEGRITSNDEMIINTEVRSLDVSNMKRGLYFLFQDEGACLTLLAVKVYYLTCPRVVLNLAQYPETPTGKGVASIERVQGKCVPHAVPKGDLFNLCQADGSWAYSSGTCLCVEGYEAHNLTGLCAPCPIGKYKAGKGNVQTCTDCPARSKAIKMGSGLCECDPGYYRGAEEPLSVPCRRPPGSPRDLKFKFLGPRTAVLNWNAPLEERNKDTKYRAECYQGCADNSVHFDRKEIPFYETNVKVSDMDFGKTYIFRIYAVNAVSNVSGRLDNYSEISIRTDDIDPLSKDADHTPNEEYISNNMNINVDQVHSHKVVLSWNWPKKDEKEDFLLRYYEVKYFPRHSEHNNSQTIVTRNKKAEIDRLKEASTYGFRVRVKSGDGNHHHWSRFSSPPVYQTTLDSFETPIFVGEHHQSGSSGVVVDRSSVIIGSITAVIVTLLLVALLFFFVRKGGSSGWISKSEKECCDSLDYRGIDSHFGNNESHPIVNSSQAQTLTSPIYNPISTPYKTYVDPHTYEDPHFAVKQFAKEIDSRFITIEAIIGGGEFGDVCRGRLSLPDRKDMLVAIKTLKPGSSEKCRADFLTEASIMGQFEHPNVIFLQGVVTKTNPIMIITEFMENGSLDTFLRANDGKFQVVQLIGMMRGIAYGMQYLSEMNYVHRDLAARNVLVNSQLVCKIADFGLSRQIADSNVDGAYTTRGGKIPVRWTAPEAIAFRKFTSSSDVWSFGIVMWEIMSYGERPYWTWSNQDVIKAIEKGYRLPAPMDCPEANHQLMLDCWQKERSHRPSFGSIVKTLDKLICCPETLRKLASDPLQNIYGSNVPDYSAFRSIEEWLSSIKMTRYSENFASAGIKDMTEVAKITLAQLQQDLGITLVGHQKKIMGSIHAMRAQSSLNVSEGFLV
uniref:receptor protein-tyrosine kinase n=1 Tax=Lepeophtheirus salmonis TaxID=72036 RepID=A0A0K2UVZ0_LEPSM